MCFKTNTLEECKKNYINVFFLFVVVLILLRGLFFVVFERTNLNSLSYFHFAPLFIPFSKFGDYENTQDDSRVYLLTKSRGYMRIAVEKFPAIVNGPLAAKVVFNGGIYQLPKHEYFGKRRTVYTVLQNAYCTVDDVSGIYVTTFIEKTGIITHRYVISCS